MFSPIAGIFVSFSLFVFVVLRESSLVDVAFADETSRL